MEIVEDLAELDRHRAHLVARVAATPPLDLEVVADDQLLRDVQRVRPAFAPRECPVVLGDPGVVERLEQLPLPHEAALIVEAAHLRPAQLLQTQRRAPGLTPRAPRDPRRAAPELSF